LSENTINITSMYFKKSKNKKKSRGNNRGGGGGGSGNNGNSRQRRKNKNKREPISEAQRLAIVNAVLNKKRLFIYAESL
jgi:hypothetical protein